MTHNNIMADGTAAIGTWDRRLAPPPDPPPGPAA